MPSLVETDKMGLRIELETINKRCDFDANPVLDIRTHRLDFTPIVLRLSTEPSANVFCDLFEATAA
jgi:hypothetical protein